MTIRSATAACFTASRCGVEVASPLTASTTVTTPFDRVAHGQIGMVENRMQDRRRIGKTRGLDDHAPERQIRPLSRLRREVFEGRDEIAAHRAAEAAGGEQDHPLVHGLHQQVIGPISPNSFMMTTLS